MHDAEEAVDKAVDEQLDNLIDRARAKRLSGDHTPVTAAPAAETDADDQDMAALTEMLGAPPATGG